MCPSLLFLAAEDTDDRDNLTCWNSSLWVPQIARPHTDAAAPRAIEEAGHIQDCVDQILAKVDAAPAAG